MARCDVHAPLPLDPAVVAGLQEHILDWYARNRRDLPWRRSTDPYAILVSETMLQQTQVARVIPKYEDFLRTYPALEDLAAAPLADVLRLWRGLGYNNRAQRLRECAVAVTGEGTVTGRAAGDPGSRAPDAPDRAAALPDTVEELRRLPGIGPYTARAVLIFAHDRDLAAVDANVRRVLTHELRLSPDLSEPDLQQVADTVLPPGRSRDWHNALMDYGALVLTARRTGIAPRTRQSTFVGSRRWQRSRLLRALLDGGPSRLDELAAALGLPPADAAAVVALLEADGLVLREGDALRVP
jgi:A/G-specific adenine glycosylase